MLCGLIDTQMPGGIENIHVYGIPTKNVNQIM